MRFGYLDDLDKANAALRLYMDTMELVDAGKLPAPDNSDIPSEYQQPIGRGFRNKTNVTPFCPETSQARRKRHGNSLPREVSKPRDLQGTQTKIFQTVKMFQLVPPRPLLMLC